VPPLFSVIAPSVQTSYPLWTLFSSSGVFSFQCSWFGVRQIPFAYARSKSSLLLGRGSSCGIWGSRFFLGCAPNAATSREIIFWVAELSSFSFFFSDFHPFRSWSSSSPLVTSTTQPLGLFFAPSFPPPKTLVSEAPPAAIFCLGESPEMQLLPLLSRLPSWSGRSVVAEPMHLINSMTVSHGKLKRNPSPFLLVLRPVFFAWRTVFRLAHSDPDDNSASLPSPRLFETNAGFSLDHLPPRSQWNFSSLFLVLPSGQFGCSLPSFSPAPKRALFFDCSYLHRININFLDSNHHKQTRSTRQGMSKISRR